MSCPSVRLNSEDTWPGPGGPDDLVKPRFPRLPRIPVPDFGDGYYRPIPPELEPPEVPGDPPGDGGDDVDPEPPYDPEKDPLGPYEPYKEPPREPGEPPGGPPEDPPLETPEGIDLEQFDRGFEDNDSFFHEDYETPDDEEPRLTPQTQEQEAGQNARLYNLWFKNIGQDLIRGQLPGLNANIGSLLRPELRASLDASLLAEYSKAENYYAGLFSTAFGSQRRGVGVRELDSYTPRVRDQASRGGLSDDGLRTAAGLAITGIGIAASFGFLYRSRLGNSIANIGGILSLEQF